MGSGAIAFAAICLDGQDGRRRRTIVDNAKRDRIETYESSNDAYVVEDMDYACLIENVQFGVTPPPPGG